MTNKQSILIIDDESEIAEILSTFLEEKYECCCEMDGFQGLERFRGGNFSAVITDLEMPDMSGVQIVKKIRETNQVIPILISTGHDFTHPKVQAALGVGAQGALLKPFLDPEKLLEEVSLVVSRQAG